MPLVPLMAGPAQAASITGVTGGYTANGTTYAKSGTGLTVNVSTEKTTRCVLFEDVTGTPVTLGSVYNTRGNGSSSWQLTVYGGSGDGIRTIRATAYGHANQPNNSSGTSVGSNVCTSNSANGETVPEATYVLDNTAPVVTGSVTPTSGTTFQNGWYNGDVIVSWKCTETGSGLAKPCPGDETVTGEGEGLSRSVTVSDNLGNVRTATTDTFRIDGTAPTTTVSPHPSGWETDDVKLNFTATDGLSGVAKTEYRRPGENWSTGTSITLGEGRHRIEYRSTDVAGNVEAIRTVTVDIDKTAPTISSSQDPAANPAGWNNSDVEVTFTCTDSLSSVASCTSPQIVSTEGTTTVTGTAVDNAGNTASLEHQVNLDKTPPTITHTISGDEGRGGWYTSDVSVSFTCTDPGSTAVPATGSGIASCAGEQTLTEGAAQSVTGNASDYAGNTASHEVKGINIDKTPPSTTSDAPSGWQNHDVTVTFTATDQEGLSGVNYTEFSLDGGNTWTTAAGGTVTLTEGTHALLFRSYDKAGNQEESKSTTVQIDTTKPTIVGTPDRPAVNGWYNRPVTISFECDDEGGSGVADGACPDDVVLGEGGDQTVTRSVSDNAGNEESITVGPINVDTTAPTTGVSAPEGWQKEEVTVTLSPTDNLSGVASTRYRISGDWVEGTEISLGEGKHTIEFFSTDRAGNEEKVQSVSVKIDLTAPTIDAKQNPSPNAAGWNNSDVTVSFDCGDKLSGVATCTAPVTVSDEGTKTVTGMVTDSAGNANSVPHTVNIDKTAPSITPKVSGTEGENGWYTSDVTVSFTCVDDRSGMAECSDDVVLTEGANRAVTGNATDLAGNDSSVTTKLIKVDKTAPVTTSNAPTGWQNHDVTVQFSATDNLSDVDHTMWSTDGVTWAKGDSVLLGEGEHTLRFYSVDKAGNTEATHSALVQVDKTAPSLSLTGPASTSDEIVTLTGTVSDSGSGVASVTVGEQDVSVNTGGTFSATVTLSKCGANTVTAVATDKAGNDRTVTLNIERVCAAPVVWSTTGFLKPVDMDKVNSAKGGSTVPLKFQVFRNGVEQTDVSVVAGMKVTSVSCKSGEEVSTVEQTATGGTSLRYTGGQFMQNWQTPKAAGCYVASVQLKDGPSISATFTLK